MYVRTTYIMLRMMETLNNSIRGVNNIDKHGKQFLSNTFHVDNSSTIPEIVLSFLIASNFLMSF